MDFDGNWIGSDNWEHLDDPNVDLRPAVYASLAATATHLYLLYADFHPRDWRPVCVVESGARDDCHENDMEGALVVVRRDGSTDGRLELVATEAHGKLLLYAGVAGVRPRSSPRLFDVPIDRVDGHPALFVEAHGHAVCALRHHDELGRCRHGRWDDAQPFPGGSGIVYRPGFVATLPSGPSGDATYVLVPIGPTLWARRGDICQGHCLFDQPMRYHGVEVGGAFDGDTHRPDSANPPWGWDDPEDGPVARGDLFFDPAGTLATWVELPGPVARAYLRAPPR